MEQKENNLWERFDEKFDNLGQIELCHDGMTQWQEFVSYHDDIKSFFRSELERAKRELAEQLIKIEKEKWTDANHCTCLGYAIVTVFGEEYEKELIPK